MMTKSVARPKHAQPWKRQSGKNLGLLLTASVAPLVIAFLIWWALSLDFMIALNLVFLPLQVIAIGVAGSIVGGKTGRADGLLVVVSLFLSAVVLVLLSSVVWSVIETGSKAISWSFVSQNNVYITPTTELGYGGVGHSVIGTLLVVGLATIIAAPLGVAIAVFLTERRTKQNGVIRTLVQALSGLPSVVSGLFIYALFIITGIAGYSGWLGSLALVPLMLPTVARVAEESLRLVPQDLRNGALALGGSAWRTFAMVTMPAAKTGLVTALLLGIARIIGETAPLIITTFASNSTNFNIFEGPISTLPTYLYQFTAFGYDTSVQRAWGAALVLLILVLILFTLARVLSRPKQSRRK